MVSIICVAVIVLCVSWLVYRYIRLKHFTVLAGLDDTRSTNVMRCAHCDTQITDDNDSGWEVFVENGYTQKICKACDLRLSTEPIIKGD